MLGPGTTALYFGEFRFWRFECSGYQRARLRRAINKRNVFEAALDFGPLSPLRSGRCTSVLIKRHVLQRDQRQRQALAPPGPLRELLQ